MKELHTTKIGIFIGSSIFFIAIVLALPFLFWNLDAREYDCGDFKTQEAAQDKYIQDTEDVYNLDLDNDGLACDNKVTS